MPVLKQEYNNLLIREAKAEIYLEDDSIPIAEREKWLTEYKKIITGLNELISRIEAEIGRKMTQDEINGGFDLTVKKADV